MPKYKGLEVHQNTKERIIIVVSVDFISKEYLYAYIFSRIKFIRRLEKIRRHNNMAILKEKFVKLFIKKHGMEIFKDIRDDIIKEYRRDATDEYIATIFNIAYTKYIGIDENKMKNFMEEILGQKNISSSEILNVLNTHDKSINKIIKFIKSTEDKEIK